MMTNMVSPNPLHPQSEEQNIKQKKKKKGMETTEGWMPSTGQKFLDFQLEFLLEISQMRLWNKS